MIIRWRTGGHHADDTGIIYWKRAEAVVAAVVDWLVTFGRRRIGR